MAMTRRAVLLISVLCLTTLAAYAEEVRIKHDGLTLNARVTLADGKALKDGAALMVHGTLAHNAMDTIQNLSDVLAERGISSLAINLSLGLDDRHGMYDCKTAHRHRQLDALDEIGAWLNWLNGQNAGPVVLFGHSRGGNQAARYAAGGSHPLVKHLVLMAPATWDRDRAQKGFERSHGKPLAGVLATARKMIAGGQGGQMLRGTGVLYCPGADVTAESFASYYEPDPLHDTPAVLKNIAVPVLVVAAGKDTVVRDLPAKVQPLADGKRLHFAVVDDADHFFLDLFAEDFADVIEEFIGAGS